MSDMTVSVEDVTSGLRIIAMMDANRCTTYVPRTLADRLAKLGLVTIVRDASWGLERVVALTEKGRREWSRRKRTA